MNKRAQSAAAHAAVTDSFVLELNRLSRAIDAALIARAGGAVLASAAGLGLLVTPAPGQAATFSVDSTADAFDDNLGDGICATVASECTLRAAIEEANTNNNGPGVVDQVTFDSALSGSIVLNGMEIPITDELTITGPGDDVLTVDAGDLSRIFNATSTTSLTTISGLTLTNGNSSYEGGAIYSSNDLVLDNVTLQNNHSDDDGGGFYIDSGNAMLTNSTVSGNTANDDGGGFYVDGDVTLTNGTVSGNTAGDDGGGFYVAYGEVTVNQSTVGSNTAGDHGGGFYAYSGDANDLVIDGSTISGNSAQITGGGFHALLFDYGNATVTSSTFIGNDADSSGGGFYLLIFDYGSATVTNSTISGNSALAGEAGGFYVGIGDYGSLSLINSTVSGNSADDRGGGFFFTSPEDASLTVTNSTISGNRTYSYGGGIAFFCASGGSAMLSNSTISGNSASEGGGMDVNASPATLLENSILANNTAATNPDADVSGTLTAAYTLVEDGSGTGLINGTNGNIVGVDPGLGPLDDNGGPTRTHAIDDTSPAFNAGDPNFTPPPDFDQRGSGFPRVAQTRLDMGAYEFQGIVATPTASLSLAGSPFAENGGVATVTATLSTTSTQDVTVEFAFAGAAALNTDFIPSATQVTIPAGLLAAGINLTGENDLVVEGPESVVVSIDSVTNAQAGTPASVTAEIRDDDQAQAEPVVPIPALGPLGLVLLPVLIPIAGWRYLRKRRL